MLTNRKWYFSQISKSIDESVKGTLAFSCLELHVLHYLVVTPRRIPL